MCRRICCPIVTLIISICLNQNVDADIVVEARVSLIHDRQVPALESGAITELLVTEGSKVEAGAVLGRIDKTLIELQGEAAKIDSEIAKVQSENDVNLRFAEKSFQVSQAELARYEEAVQAYPRAISKSELEETRFNAQRAEMSIEQAEMEMKTARLTSELKQRERDIAMTHVKQSKIEAPVSGMVVEVFRRSGEWVQVGQPVLRVISLDRLRVEMFLQEQDCDASATGKGVVFKTTIRGKQRTYKGKITFVSPEISPVDGQVRVWAEVDNQDGLLRPGAFGEAVIDVEAVET